jgi:YggT family protein
MNSSLLSPFEFLLTTLIDLYLMAVLLRFLLQWSETDFYNPISQFVVKATNPVLLPLRRVIPSWKGQDNAALVLALGLKMLLVFLFGGLWAGRIGPLGVLFVSVAQLVDMIGNIFIFAIFAQAILSWVTPHGGDPLNRLLYGLTRPVLRPFRKFIPPIGGLDLTPLAAIIALQFVKMLAVGLLRTFAGM